MQVLADGLEKREEMIAKHTAKYEKVCPPRKGKIPQAEACLRIKQGVQKEKTSGSAYCCSRYREQERSPLIDTAPDIRRMPRTPTLREFHPIGHVALDSKPHEDERLGLLSPASLNGNGAKGIFWIGVLYISWELQRLGLGGAAMREVEALAAQKPLNGHTTVLDAVPAEFQLREDVVQRIYLSQGNPVPTVSCASPCQVINGLVSATRLRTT